MNEKENTKIYPAKEYAQILNRKIERKLSE